MKTFTSILLFLCIILALCACSSPKDSSEVLSQQSLADASIKKSLWKKVTKNEAGITTNTVEYDYTSLGKIASATHSNETDTVITYYEYDDNGYTSKEELKRKNGSFISCIIYENDSNGRVLKTRVLDVNGNTQSETVILLNENGNIAEEKIDGKTVKIYTYDSDGNYRITAPDQNGYSEYDKNGNILSRKDDYTSTTYTYTDGLLTEVLSNVSGVIFKTTYEYDKRLIVRQTNYENDKPQLIFNYEYDNEFYLIKESIENAIGVKTSVTYYEYKSFGFEAQ